MRAIGFVLELPWDLGLPRDHVVPFWGDDEPEPGQSLPAELRSASTEGRQLRSWMHFRTVRIAGQRPLAASDIAFGDLDSGRSRFARWRRRAKVAVLMVAGPREPRTVVLAYAPVNNSVATGNDIASEAFTEALDSLNQWLIALGVTRDDRLRPLAPEDLPPLIPMMPAEVDHSRAVRHGERSLLLLRDPMLEATESTEEELRRATALQALINSDPELAPFYELVQRAGGSRRAGRDREAVIDYCTAGELLVTATLRRAGPLLGIDSAKLANVVGANFKNRLRHFSQMLGWPPEPEDQSSPLLFWYLHCYRQRNQIVHDGANSSPPRSETARLGLVTLVVETRDALRARPATKELARAIQWGFRVDETGAGDDSWPDPLP